MFKSITCRAGPWPSPGTGKGDPREEDIDVKGDARESGGGKGDIAELSKRRRQ